MVWSFQVSRAQKRLSFQEGQIVDFRYLRLSDLRGQKNRPFLEGGAGVVGNEGPLSRAILICE
jgi:hypothetical protein